MSLTVEPEDGETVVLGKTTSDLQEGVVVDDNEIRGTLKKVTGYTGFSGVTAEQSGNYLVLKFTPSSDLATAIAATPAEASIAVELINGTVGHPVTLDSDPNMVLRITNPITQRIKVYVTEGDTITTHEYTLDKLKLLS